MLLLVPSPSPLAIACEGSLIFAKHSEHVLCPQGVMIEALGVISEIKVSNPNLGWELDSADIPRPGKM